MTHFNHEWDTTKTPAVPVSVGDRYYAQDLNDDFNYLKHLPYEVFLQGRSRGVMIAPNNTWDNDTNSLTLSGGFGVVLQDCIELDPDEDFVIPPKTHSSPRYERIPFTNTTLVLPNDNAVHYIVATPTKRSLLQRTKALFTEQYASRVRYDGIITIQDTAPTAGQILVGLCHNKEYCLLIDNNPDQHKDNIVLKKWFGQSKITNNFVSVLQSYYDISTASIETEIFIDTVSGNDGISGGTFNNCTIIINTLNDNDGISGGTFNNCTITIDFADSWGINGGTFNNCTININTPDSHGIQSGTFNNCIINFGAISGSAYNYGINNGTFNNCIINFGAISSGMGIYSAKLNYCIIKFSTINSGGIGVNGGTFNTCIINFDGLVSSTGINNTSSVYLYLTRIIYTAGTMNISNTSGKLNVCNNTVIHAS